MVSMTGWLRGGFVEAEADYRHAQLMAQVTQQRRPQRPRRWRVRHLFTHSR
jgi:hypothetical protein